MINYEPDFCKKKFDINSYYQLDLSNKENPELNTDQYGLDLKLDLKSGLYLNCLLTRRNIVCIYPILKLGRLHSPLIPIGNTLFNHGYKIEYLNDDKLNQKSLQNKHIFIEESILPSLLNNQINFSQLNSSTLTIINSSHLKKNDLISFIFQKKQKLDDPIIQKILYHCNKLAEIDYLQD